jgi:hypothetical protein
MADDINTCTGFGSNDADKRVTGAIKYGNPVVQAPRKSSTTNNFVSESTYTAYTRPSGSQAGIGNIKGRYDARFDDPTYYSN